MRHLALVSALVTFVSVAACGDDSASDSTEATATSSGAGASAATGPGATTTTTTGTHAASASASTGGGGRDYSTDASKFYGDSRCAEAGVTLCDDFESGTIDTGTWESNGATPTIDGTHAARGSKALHVHTEGNGFSFLKETKTFPAPNDTYWGRMFVWIDAVPIQPDWSHWTLVGAKGADHPGEIRVGGQFNPQIPKNLFGVGTDGGATGDWTHLDDDPESGAAPVPVQTWVCLEWMHDGASNETKFYEDAVEHPSLATTATDHGGDQSQDYLLPTFESVWVGWWLYQGSPTPDHYDVWIDEVVIDNMARVGCVL